MDLGQFKHAVYSNGKPTSVYGQRVQDEILNNDVIEVERLYHPCPFERHSGYGCWFD
jgi:hypothetical protein